MPPLILRAEARKLYERVDELIAGGKGRLSSRMKFASVKGAACGRLGCVANLERDVELFLRSVLASSGGGGGSRRRRRSEAAGRDADNEKS